MAFHLNGREDDISYSWRQQQQQQCMLLLLVGELLCPLSDDLPNEAAIGAGTNARLNSLALSFFAVPARLQICRDRTKETYLYGGADEF